MAINQAIDEARNLFLGEARIMIERQGFDTVGSTNDADEARNRAFACTAEECPKLVGHVKRLIDDPDHPPLIGGRNAISSPGESFTTS